MRFDRIGINVTFAGGAGAAARLGIYRVDPDTYYPTGLVLDAGAVDCTILGLREITINQILERGWWLLTTLNNDITISMSYNQQGISPLGGVGPINLVNYGWSVAQAYGALPNPFPAGGIYHGAKFEALRVAELL